MSKSTIQIECKYCNKEFSKYKSEYNRQIKTTNNFFCSSICHGSYNSLINAKTVHCTNCNETIHRRNSDKSKLYFCSHSCNAIYYNSRKTTGTNVSKLEKYLQIKLKELYPNLDFIFNSSREVGLELDIYIPSLKLAFELNGIFHYEPIFGQDKLNRTQFNDNQKFQACISKTISLCVIDTTSQKYFKESTSQKFLDIITSIIDSGPCETSNSLLSSDSAVC